MKGDGESERQETPIRRAVDVHDGLRVYWTDGIPHYSAEAGVNVERDVREAASALRAKADALAAWWDAWRRTR